MKAMSEVLKYINIILDKAMNEIPVDSIKIKDGERESFKHALQDLICNGMVVYTQLNPVIKIKRIA